MARKTASDAPSGSPRQRLVLLAQHWWWIEARERGIIDYAQAHGWQLLDLRCFEMKMPRFVRPDGVLFSLAQEELPLARKLLRAGVPAVQIQDQFLPIQCPSVSRDRVMIGRIAAEHFAERGFKQVAYVRSLDWEDSPEKPICESFVSHARTLGMEALAFTLGRPGEDVPWTRVGVFARRLKKELVSIKPPVGIFTHHDIMASRLCHFCAAAGLRVPEQVAVLGMGNNPLICGCAPVPLSSVDSNQHGCGWSAAELLDQLMDGRAAPAKPVLVSAAGVVTRRSTDVLAVPDVDTARALRYLWEHLGEPLTVSKVAGAVGVSRRTLDRSFRTYLGRSVTDELNRKRIERACELLVRTRLSVISIARQVGFRTESYLFRVFREHMGTTPKRYRLAHTPKGGLDV